jgi:hypothetical protein
MLNLLVFGNEIQPIQSGEHGYCSNHPDVVAGRKTLVVDRAIKQLLVALQGVKLEIGEDPDGIILNLGYTPQGGGPNGLIRVAKATGKLQYYDVTATAWKDVGSGGGVPFVATSEDNDGICFELGSTPNNGRLRVEKSTGWLQYYSKDWDEWYYFDILAEAKQFMENATVPTDVIVIDSNTVLIPAQVIANRMIFVTAACTLTMPSCFNSARCTIWTENCSVIIKAHSDPMRGATIRLPDAAAGVYQIHNTSAGYGDCVVLRSYANQDLWRVESLIGTWGAAG